MSKKEKLNKLKKLSPDERIEELKKLQEESKKEIEEAQELIKQSEDQAEKEHKLQQQIPVPQLQAVDIESLFSPEEKQLFKSKRYTKDKKEKPLEETVAQERPKKIPEEIAQIREYGFELSRQPASALREKAENIYQAFQQSGELTYQQSKDLDAIGYAEQYKLNEIQTGGYDADKRVAADMVITQKIKNWLQDKYKGHSLYKSNY